MTTIYLVRHAEAEGNIYRRAHGQFDSNLTPNGEKQLERLAERFRGIRLDGIYSSDLRRTMRTAGAVSLGTGIAATPDKRLREINLGQWEDQPWALLERTDGENYAEFCKYGDFHIEGAETISEVRSRITTAIRELARQHDGGSFCAVSHGMALKSFLDYVAGTNSAHLDNASVTLLEYGPGGFSLTYAGDNAHLGNLSTLAKQNWWRSDGKKDFELWFQPVSYPDDGDWLTEAGSRAWKSVYNTYDGFDRSVFAKLSHEAWSQNPRYVQKVMLGDKAVGALQMRENGRISSHDGHIGLVYLVEEYRGRGLGGQLIGEAISIARSENRQGVSLRSFYNNTWALALYKKLGFKEIGTESGSFGEIKLMRLPV